MPRGSFDLLIRNGHVIDPANGIDGVADLLTTGGKVVAVKAELGVDAARVLDASGCYVMPGLVDLHVHLSSEFNGPLAHNMLARAGVTTALDLAGPVEDVLDVASRHGAGLTIGCLQRLKPGESISSPDPSRGELERAIDAALLAGALGVKLLGGHYPLTPEATAQAIALANDRPAYVAFHCGTTATGSHLGGLREAIELTGKHRVHLAHINSYCRGQVREPLREAFEALELLRAAPHLFSESYLALVNGTSARCVDGVPESAVTRAVLKAAGYAATQEGLRRAILDGYASVHVPVGETVALLSGPQGVRRWEASGTQVGVSFPVNLPLPATLLATARDATGDFLVDALATDGGGIPRNTTVERGLLLVEMGLLSRSDFVRKASWVGAQVLGLAGKGHLSPGADADVVVVDPGARRVRTTVAGGQIVMHEGIVFGTGTRVLTTAQGAQAVRSKGLIPITVDVSRSGLYSGRGLKRTEPPA